MESKANYVCGFYFDHKFQQVVLIWKNKPAWQKGKLNGVGGKIESGESPIAAMRREFHEETGILHNEWVDLTILSGKDWRVYFFCAIGNVNEFEYVESKEDEEVAKIEVDRLYSDYPHIPNLDWLVPMAINKLSCPEEFEEITALKAKCERYEKALQIVQKWQLPATGQFWDDDRTRPMSYGACYGSNGERDFMRGIANEALAGDGEREVGSEV